MVSKEHKRASPLHGKLPAITHSPAVKKTSIIGDASTKYIKKLKENMERLNQDRDQESVESSSNLSSLPVATVETLEKGFLIDVFSDKSCPGLLVSVLETFEELGLVVLEARASCTDSFRLQAVVENEEHGEAIAARVVRQALVQAIKTWSEIK